MARPLKPFVRSGGYYPSEKYTPLVYPGGYTTLNAKNGKPEPLNTFVGKIVQFLAKRSLPMVKLEANFTPIQSLNGQEAPYPPGGGKNLLDIDTINVGKNYNGGDNSERAVMTLSLPAGTYTISIQDMGTLSEASAGRSKEAYPLSALSGIVDDGPLNSTTKSRKAVIDETYPYIYIFVRKSGGITLSDIQACKFMVESGDQATAYAPYSNICPISGHTGCEVYDNGVQQWDEEWEVGSIDGSGNNETANDRIRSKNYIPVIPNTTYYITAPYGVWFWGYDADKVFSARVPSSSSINNTTFTVPSGVYYLRFVVRSNYGTTYNHDISINYPSTDHDYHAYSGTTVSISFGQTVYGGKLTVFEDGSGQIDANMAGVDLGTLSWGRNATNASGKYSMQTADLASVVKHPSSNTEVANLLCSRYKTTFANNIYGRTVGIACYASGNIAVYDEAYDNGTPETIAAFKTAMSGVQLVYELAEPITIQLTASQINTLVGENVVWVNDATGDITVQAYGTEIV